MALPDQTINPHPPGEIDPAVVEKKTAVLFAPIAIAELGLSFKPHSNPHQLKYDQALSTLSNDPKVIKATRYSIWQETGYVPSAAGGEDKKESSNEMNWAIFDDNPSLARTMLSDIYKREHPEWDEITLAREVAKSELDRKIERHSQLHHELGEADEQVYTLKEDIKFWRLVLRGL